MNYYLFAGDDYYPCGGHNDLKASAKSLEEIANAFKTWIQQDDPTIGMCWAHVCFGSDLLLLATANFNREFPHGYCKNMVELFTYAGPLWEGSEDYIEPLKELNKLTRLAFLGETT